MELSKALLEKTPTEEQVRSAEAAVSAAREKLEKAERAYEEATLKAMLLKKLRAASLFEEAGAVSEPAPLSALAE